MANRSEQHPNWVVLLFSILAILSSQATADALRLTQAQKSTLPATEFVSRQGQQLFLHGKPYRFIGINTFALTGCLGKDSADDSQRDALFASLRPDSVVRVFGTPNVPLPAMEKVIQSAAKYHQMIIWVLSDGVGGCGDTTKATEWFRSGYKDGYRQWVTNVVSRFSDNVTIAMWELINEPKTDDLAALRAFYDDMGGLVHGLDHNHLVISGALAPWAYKGLSGYQYIHASPGVDVASLHEYDQVPRISDHALLSLKATKAVDKPLIIGEFGISASVNGDPSKKTDNGGRCESFKSRAEMARAKLMSYFGNYGVAGALYWSYFPTSKLAETCRYETYPGDPLLIMLKEFPLSDQVTAK